MIISIFSGGTGGAKLREGLYKIITYAQVYNWINLDDAGKSTGIVAEITKTLGVSDARKNLSLYYSLKHKEEINKNILSFMEGRFFLGKSINEAKKRTHELLNEWNIDPRFIEFSDFFFKKAKEVNYNGVFEDFNVANIIMGASFAINGIDETINMIKEILDVKELSIVVPWHNYNILQGVTESGVVLDNEGKIVDWANPNDIIKEVYFVDGKTGKKSYEYELYDENYLKILDESDLIILSTGTQWSSLIPSYMNSKVKASLEKNAEKVVLCVNNRQDKDMYGVDYKKMLKIINNYLDISQFKILFNQDADASMKPKNAKYMFAFGNDLKGKSDPQKFAKAVLITRYDILEEQLTEQLKTGENKNGRTI